MSYLLVLTPFFVCTETPSISPLPRLNSSQSKSSCLQVASISYLTWQFTLLVYWSPSWVKKEKASSAPTEIEVEDLPSGQTYSEWKKINNQILKSIKIILVLLPSATTKAREARRPSRALLECTISSLNRYDDNVGMIIIMKRICGPIYMTVETTHRCGAITWDTGLCTVAIVTLLSY